MSGSSLGHESPGLAPGLFVYGRSMGQLEASTEGAAGAASEVTPGSITLADGPIRPIGPPGRVPISGQTRQILARTPAANPGTVGRMIDHPPLPDFGDELGLYLTCRLSSDHLRLGRWTPPGGLLNWLA